MDPAKAQIDSEIQPGTGPETFEEQFYEAAWQKMKRDNYLSHTAGLDVAVELIGSGERLLDVGCGRGEFDEKVQGRFQEMHGVDISATALEFARKVGLIAQQVNLNTDPLPYPDNHFDSLISLDVIEHVLDPLPVAREMARVLKPGGRILLQSHNIRYWRHIWAIIRGRFPLTVGRAPDDLQLQSYNYGHLSNFTFSDLEDLLRRCGIQVTHKIGTGRKPPKRLTTRLKEGLLPEGFKREFLSPGLMVAGANG